MKKNKKNKFNWFKCINIMIWCFIPFAFFYAGFDIVAGNTTSWLTWYNLVIYLGFYIITCINAWYNIRKIKL